MRNPSAGEQSLLETQQHALQDSHLPSPGRSIQGVKVGQGLERLHTGEE